MPADSQEEPTARERAQHRSSNGGDPELSEKLWWRNGAGKPFPTDAEVGDAALHHHRADDPQVRRLESELRQARAQAREAERRAERAERKLIESLKERAAF